MLTEQLAKSRTINTSMPSDIYQSFYKEYFFNLFQIKGDTPLGNFNKRKNRRIYKTKKYGFQY